MKRPKTMVIWVICALFGLVSAPADAAPQVIASIKPVYGLVAAVMDGVGRPHVLIAGNGSPHSYSLRPSDAKVLGRSDVVFWIGPGFENFLAKPLGTLAAQATHIALIAAPGVIALKPREGGVWEPHDDEPAGGAEEVDGHIWLDPNNAKAMVAEIARVLAQVDPTNAPRYAANAATLTRRIGELDAEIQSGLDPVRSRPFVVFHDAYQYFQQHYRVNAVGSVTVSPDRPPGARRVSQIRAKIASLSAACVFAEPQFEPKLIQTLVADTHARVAILDPEGSTLPADAEVYFTLMRGLAESLSKCLNQ